MGEDFDAARNDDSFYLPRAVLHNPDFKQAMDTFLSPDGKAARFIISDRGDPATPEAISRVDLVKAAAEESLKATPLEDAKIYLAGVSATYKDVRDASKYDLLIVGIASLCLIFIIMLVITRSFVAALVIVGTVVLSLGASFGLSVLVWQYLVGMELYWLVLAMSVIVLLAVGSDYNLLLVARFKEEIDAGINTGIIRRNGRYRQGGDVRRPGVRIHHGIHGGQRPTRRWPNWNHHRSGSAVRHVDRALAHDAVHRGAAGTLVLVAAENAPRPGQLPTSALRTPSGGSFSPAAPGSGNCWICIALCSGWHDAARKCQRHIGVGRDARGGEVRPGTRPCSRFGRHQPSARASRRSTWTAALNSPQCGVAAHSLERRDCNTLIRDVECDGSPGQALLRRWSACSRKT